MCRKLVLLLIVFGVIAAFSSVASAAIITNVVRSGGNSDDRAPIGPFVGNTPPLATQAGGLTDGNYVFSDREYTWINTPIDVEGAEYVRTFNTDKGSNVTYTVTFSTPATVLLTCDDRFGDLQTYADNIVTNFAAAGEFTDTGWDVFVGGDSDRQLSVFSAVLPAGIYTFVAPPSGNNFYVIGAMPPPAPNRKAHNPDPEDGLRTRPSGVEGAGFYMLLEFEPGHGAITHTAYFSDKFEDVNERNEDVCLGSPPWPAYIPFGYYAGLDDETLPDFARVPLGRNITYYWVVDESNDVADYPGDVWSFTIASEEAWDPSPADGARYVFGDPSVTLSWQMGDVDEGEYKITYDVYHGTDEAAVEAGTATFVNVEVTNCTIGPLAAGEDYYWKVNTRLMEKHEPFGTRTIEGYVWHFGTKPFIPITDDPTLIGWWTFDEGGGDVAIDWSGYDNDGVIVGGAERVPGKIEDAIELNGVNQRVDISLTNGVPTAVNPPEISIAMWVKPDMTNGTRTMFYVDELHRDNGGTGYGRIRCRINGGNWQFRSGEAVSQSNIDAVGPAVVTGEWVHYAGVKIDNDALYVYIDGALGGTANFGVGGILLPDCSIGGENDGDDPFDGLIDEVRLYLRGLSQSEVQHIMDPSAPYNPKPTDGEVDVAIGSKLTWSPGTDDSTGSAYTEHDVYFGASFDDVESATEPVITLTGPNEYTPTLLEYNTSYYWRIDGVTGGVPYTGSVWTFRATYNPADVADPHLKLWLKFDGDASDSSGHGRHGVEMGGPVYVPGYDGEAISLDGIDDYVDIEYSVGISGAEPRTIVGWAKATTTAIVDWTDVFGFTGPSGAGGHFDIEIVGATDSTTAGYYGLHMYGDEYDIMPCDLEWHHLAATYDGALASWYADGDQMGFAAPTDTGGAPITINTPGDVHVGKRDDNSNYFPGAIDDVRIYDYVLNATQIATVMRVNLAWAWNPNPDNGAVDVDPDVTLSWNAGDGATAHSVWFGADDPANMALMTPTPQTGTTYDPGTLALDTTYYWRIVESPGMDPGRIWKFTTMNYIVIDNMDAYVAYDVPAGPHIFVAWRDGKGDCDGSGNETGANLIESTPSLFADSQLMEYDWDNDGYVFNPCSGNPDEFRPNYYSKIEAQVAGLPSGIGSNWTTGGVKALSLLFYGDPLNSINDPLWVQLSDGSGPGEKVEYGKYADESLADIQDPNWHEWLIDLADLGVDDLTNVVSIAIGIGDENATSPHISSGTLYFDDVRLYTPRCIPSRNSADFAKVDYAPEGAPDCVVNYKELEIMTRDWLDYDGAVIDIDAVDPGVANLVASYKFTGNFNDSSANAIHGAQIGGVSTSYDADLASDVAVFDGLNDYVDLGNPPKLDFSTGSWTVGAWIKPITTTDQHTIYCKGGDAAGGIRYMLTVAETNDHRMTVTTDDNSDKYQRHGDIQVDDGEWHHVVGMRDGTLLRVYVDGIDDGETTIPAGYDLSGTSQANAYIGANWNYETSVVQKFFHGSMDDVRVYSKALSQAEVISTMGLSSLYSKVESAANVFDLEGDKNQVINFKDFCVLADNWGEEMEWPSW